jgi:hypothetical protein
VARRFRDGAAHHVRGNRQSHLAGFEMARPVKLYNHSLAPNPRRVRIFAAEKGIELALEDIDILAGQSRMPEFLR